MTLGEEFAQKVGQDLGEEAYQPGLQALKRADRNRVRLAEPRRCNGSADIDSALAAQLPNSSRWDYVVAHDVRLHFIEVHPATTSNVAEMQDKKRWLDSWLDTAAIGRIEAKRCFHWVASGKVAILRNSKQARRLAATGLKPVKQLSL